MSSPRLKARQRLGRRGERLAKRYLKRQGFRIIACNWRCKLGEIDIIAGEKDTIVIVEVRTSRSTFRGGPIYSIGPQKQHKLMVLTQQWLKQNPTDKPIRVDAIAIVISSIWQYKLEHFRDIITLYA